MKLEDITLEKILYHFDFTNDLDNLKKCEKPTDIAKSIAINSVKSATRGYFTGYLLAIAVTWSTKILLAIFFPFGLNITLHAIFIF